jgi:hypothetical protein
MGFVNTRRGRALGDAGADIATISARWAALHEQVYQAQQSGAALPAGTLEEYSRLHDQLMALQDPENPEAPVHNVTVTPELARQVFFERNVDWGDHGAALNDALLRWAETGTWQTVTNPDGSISGGIDFTRAPADVRDAHRALYGDDYGTAAFTHAPGALPATDVGDQGDQAPMLNDDGIIAAIDAVAAAGGDVTQPTQVVDQRTGETVAIVRQLPSGSISVESANARSDLAGIVNSVTGFIDRTAGTITNIGTQVRRVGNAIEGAAAGAKTGYNAPTSWTPILLGVGALIGGGLLLSRRRSPR